jgi:hypothetical protein
MPRLLASMMRFSIWSLMPRPWRPPMALASQHQVDRGVESRSVDRDRPALLEAHRDVLGLDLDGRVPVRDAHDRLDDLHAVDSSSRSFASWVAPQMLASVE